MIVKREDQKKWHVVKISCPTELCDIVSDIIFEIGSVGIQETKSGMIAFFEESFQAEMIKSQFSDMINGLNSRGVDTGQVSFDFESLQGRDWNQEWKDSYQTIHINEKIVIKPSWEPMPDIVPECLIEIDPEMAFGSGTHETTSLILRNLEYSLSTGDRVLDIGTGTGILGIAALKLGAGDVVAFDIDPIAAETARNNAGHNGVINKFYTFAGSIDALLECEFDLILANINRTVIVQSLHLFKEFMHPSSDLVLSGILAEEKSFVENVLNDLDFQILSTEIMGEWIFFQTGLKS